MESLYTKYRPQTFQDVVGQQVVVSTLEHAVLEGRIGHAYLFCGPRGTGKTTMARLLAKALMCDNGPGKLPDGTCEQCKLIAAGEHPDVYELDAASRTGVDNVREEIINRVSYAPVRGRYKVYIIDEVHMLTTAAFNALLKTLEEPPEHVVFILCTTDPQKIPATIISRVQRFDFHAISNDEIHQRLAYVCQQEGFTYDDKALDLVVRHARGGMRDALSTLEQLSVFGNGSVTLDAAQDMLGSVPGSTLNSVCEAMAKRDVAALYQEVGTLVSGGRDLLQFVRELAGRARDIYVVSAVGTKENVVSASADELEELKREAQLFGSNDRLSYVLTVLGDASNEMRTATNQRLSLEIALTRIARPESDLTLESLAARVAELEGKVSELLARGVPAAGAVTTAPPSVSAPQQQAAPNPAPAAPTSPAPVPQPVTSVPSQQRGIEQRNTGAPHSSRPNPETPVVAPQSMQQTAPQRTAAQQARQAQPVAPAATSSAAITDPGELQRRWKQAVDELIKRVPSRGSLLMSSSIVSDSGDTLTVSLPKGSTFALKMLDRADVRQAIEPQISQVFGGARNLKFVEAAPSPRGDQRRSARPMGPSRPAQQPTRPAQVAQQSARAPQPVRSAPANAAPAAGFPSGSPQRPQTQPAPVQPVPETKAAAVPQGTGEAASTASKRYDMPWDPVPSAPVEAPHEEVPYDDADAVPYGEEIPPYEEPSSGAPTSSPAPGNSRSGGPASQAQAAPVAASGTASATTQTNSADASSEAPVAFDADSIPDDIPDDLRSVIEDCFEVFGDGVRVSSVQSNGGDNNTES